MKHFAIVRHGKIKGGRHLVSTGLHNARGAMTANAVPGIGVEVLIGTKKPHRDVMQEVRRRGITKLRKNGVVAVEVLCAASPEWWEAKGWKSGEKPTGETLALVEEWKAANLAYLMDRFGDRLVSVIYHGDEASPHMQALAVPVALKTDKRSKDPTAQAWRLDASIDVGSPGRLKERVTDYAKRMARFGLVRGEDVETGKRIAEGRGHRPQAEWQAEQGEALESLRMERDAFERARGVVEGQGTALKRERAEVAEERARAAQERQEAEKARSMAQEALERQETASRAAQRHEAEARAASIKLEAKHRAVDRMMGELEGIAAVFKTMAARMKAAVGREVPLVRSKGGREAVEATETAEFKRFETLARGKRDGGRG